MCDQTDQKVALTMRNQPMDDLWDWADVAALGHLEKLWKRLLLPAKERARLHHVICKGHDHVQSMVHRDVAESIREGRINV